MDRQCFFIVRPLKHLFRLSLPAQEVWCLILKCYLSRPFPRGASFGAIPTRHRRPPPPHSGRKLTGRKPTRGYASLHPWLQSVAPYRGRNKVALYRQDQVA